MNVAVGYKGLCATVAFEATYQLVRAAIAPTTVLLSREQFCRAEFPALVDCDVIYEMLIHGKPLKLMAPKGPPLNGGAAQRPFRG
jgi:hypothetical protein